MNSNRAKKTSYNGIVFRSETEARWAVFFDCLNIEYQYEPEWDEVKYGGIPVAYKPDFYLPQLDQWCEVKPHGHFDKLPDDEIRKILGWAKDYGHIIVLAGKPSIPRKTTKAHYAVTWNLKKKIEEYTRYMWWCECLKCGKIGIEPFGGNPIECDDTCFGKPQVNLFGEELYPPDGTKSKRLKEAVRVANHFEF